MKKLLILFGLFLGLGTANGQTKKAESKPTATKTQQTDSIKDEQVKGPTKEETISFLKSQVDNYEMIYSTGGTKFLKNYKYYNKIIFEDCLITVQERLSYKDDYLSGYKSNYIRVRTISFDIQNIEKINEVEFLPEKESSTTLYGLEFISKNGEKLINEKITINGVLNNDDVDTNNSKLQSDAFLYVSFEGKERIKQAFNHLRKLCGAPEPISFD